MDDKTYKSTGGSSPDSIPSIPYEPTPSNVMNTKEANQISS